MRTQEFSRESVLIKFKTPALNEAQLKSYLIKLCNVYDTSAFSYKSMTGLTRFDRINESEYTEYNEIKPLIDAIPKLSTVTGISIGDNLSVLVLEIMFAYQEISVLANTVPKEVTDIKMFATGEINYILFTDGTRYPEISPATYGGKPVEHAMYFNTQDEANSALEFIILKMPSTWEIIGE